MRATGGGGTTVNVRVAGVPSRLPAASRARTWKVCPSVASGGSVRGDEHGANAPASTRHWKLAPLSFALKANDGMRSLVDPLGPAVIVVSGAIVSTRKPRLAGVGSV